MKALIFENKVVDVVSEEFEVHESMTWMDCPDECEGNWTLENNTLIAPVPMEPRTYDSNRRKEYPSIGDQLDMIFHAGLGGDEFQAAIQAVKDKYPKPAI
jgi:hypothetical protein